MKYFNVSTKDPNFEVLLRDTTASDLEQYLFLFYLDFKIFGYDIKPFYDILEKKKRYEKLGLSYDLSKKEAEEEKKEAEEEKKEEEEEETVPGMIINQQM